jgi:hypothetical protein
MDPTAAPVDLVIGTVTYKAHPLRDKDHEEYNKWVRREYLRRVKEATDDPEMLKIALRDTVTMNWMLPPGRSISMSVAGVAKLASLMCRCQITEDMISNDDAIDTVMSAFRFVHELDTKEPTEPTEGNSEGN